MATISRRAAYWPIAIGLLCISAGCKQKEKVYPKKAALPVTVMRLEVTSPKSTRLYAGSVRSWKIEDISFEVDGRVRWVVEPGIEIEGRSYKANGELLSPGTQIAQLDDERFVTALESAKSKVQIESYHRDSAQVQLEESLPAEVAAAQAEYDLALTEYQRNQRLVAQKAGARKNLDKAKAMLDAAKSSLDGLNAKKLLAKADLESAEAAIQQALQAQKDAQRNLDDTKLYSAFRGQIAAVHVVPGSLAGSQSKVVTIQMMNPIKIDLEISAGVSRQIQLGDMLPLTFQTDKNTQEHLEASVYTIAPSADNATRTFTLTLLVVNRKVETEVPPGIDRKSIGITPHLWQVGMGILPPTPPGVYFMPEYGLHTDGEHHYVWRVTNFKLNEPVQRVLKVEKLFVKPGDLSLPFLGQMRFRTVTILPDQNFDPKADLIANNLFVGGKRKPDWEGDTMLLDRGIRWLLRPGDVVNVDLSSEQSKPGIFVPVQAIHEKSGRTSVFVLVTNKDKTTVQEVEILVDDSGSSQTTSTRRIQPADQQMQLEGKQIVVEGVHYLIDGQHVAITANHGEDR